MIDTKKDLLALSDIIRNKYQQLRAGQRNESFALETRFKPIIEPLKKLVTIKNETSEIKTPPIPSPHINYTPFVKKASKKRKLSYGEGKQEEQDERVDFLQDSNVDVYEESDVESPQAHFQAAMSTPGSKQSAKTYFKGLYGDIAGKYIFEMFTNKNSRVIDTVYGLRYDKDSDQFYIGSEQAKIEKNDLNVNGEWYEGTIGLYELLVKQKPVQYSENDLKNYQSIMETTNAYKRNYSSFGQIAGNRSYKYMNIIKKHIADQNKLMSAAHGEGMALSVLNKKKSELVYWDDPNELVDRLRLLYASQAAGHNNHQNEINSIVEELRESNLIH